MAFHAPLTPEELADRVAPEQVALSPDGRSVAFVAGPIGFKGKHPARAIWLSRDGAPAEPFTAGVAADGEPRWSPDGARLLFVSDREERKTNRLYLIKVDGGEARPLGELKGELESPRWSPDGASIAVIHKDRDTPGEKKRQEEDREDAVVVDGDPKRRRLWVVDAAAGKARQLTFGTRQVWDFGWSRDGRQLAVVTTDEAEYDAVCRESDLWLLPLAGGLLRLVARFPYAARSPIFVESPEGPAVAVMTNGHRADPADSVWLAPIAGGSPRNLLPGFGGNVDALVAVPDDPGRLVIAAGEDAHEYLYAVDVATGGLTPISPRGFHGEGAVLDAPSVSRDGAMLAFVWSDGPVPHEVYVGAAGGEAKAVSDFGKAFLGRLSPVEEVRWACDGVEIGGLLTLPAGYEAGRRYPLVVEVHGGPSGQWDDACFLDWHDWAQYLASHGYAVLAPNPRGSTGRGNDYQQMLQDDVGGGESRDLIAGALAMVERGIADVERLGIAGWSWGGYLTAYTITQTDLFKAAVMGAGLSNMVSDHGTDDIPSANLLYYPGLPYHHLDAYWQSSAIRHVANCTTPTLILHGDDDARVHVTQGMEMHRALKSLGVPVEFVRYPREPHSFKERAHQIDLLRRLLAWLDRWLKA